MFSLHAASSEFISFFIRNSSVYAFESEMIVSVEEPSSLVSHGLYKGGGVGDGLTMVGAVVYVKNYRE
jgi:hypothetical protein